MDHISRISASAPKDPTTQSIVVLRVTWDPTRRLSHVVITASRGLDGDSYGPWETSCGCHGGSGPLVPIMTALDTWWREGALGMELWEDEQAHTCRVEHRQQSK